MSAPENPAAFPNPARGYYGTDGMSLRDWFAGRALSGILAANAPCGGEWPARSIAAAAYIAADAMLAAREGRLA